ncbi:MAG: (2Fe-2S)-binding protein [Neisseria sp.]|nr:(2Fe-2S)-binding protein [Neisseria sp.]
MFVCICNAVTDRQIQEVVAAGANSLSDLKAQLGVATCCGCCSDLASSYLGASNAQAASNAASAIRVDM